jgi:HK97 family phage prohead protease
MGDETMVGEYPDREQRYSVCMAQIGLKAVDLKPTEAMAEEAERGLEWRREFGRGGTEVGVARARDISNRVNLSADTVGRMVSFFARHEVDKQAEGFRPGEEGYPSNGRIAWALWGGDPGKAWAEKKQEQLKKEVPETSYISQKQNTMYQIKSIPVIVKDMSLSDRTVTGYFASFGNVDYDQDMFEPGSFNKTIAEWGPNGRNKIVHLYQHDTAMPLAKPKVLQADDYGVYFESQFATTSWGNDVLKLYEAGIINEHSVGFQIMRSMPETVEGKSFNRINEVRMWEGSTVTFGANEETPFSGMKSMTKPEIMERVVKLTKAVRNGTFTDETFHLLEIQLAQLNQFIAQNLPDDGGAERKLTQPEITPEGIDEAIESFTIKHLIKWN